MTPHSSNPSCYAILRAVLFLLLATAVPAFAGIAATTTTVDPQSTPFSASSQNVMLTATVTETMGGDPVPEVSWSTPARGEVRVNTSLLALHQVTRADAGHQSYHHDH